MHALYPAALRCRTLLTILLLALLAVACGTAEPTATPTVSPTPTPDTGAGPAATPAPTPGWDGDAYFAGKTVQIVVGSTPGGGFDIYARLVAQHANRHFPSSTRFIVVNRPGAGQLLGAQYTWASEPNGLTAGLIHTRWYFAALLGEEVRGMDLEGGVYVGTPSGAASSNFECIDTRHGTSWEDVLLMPRPLTIGQLAPGASVGAAWLELIGAPVRMVYGYGGASEALAAFDRGELTGLGHCAEGNVMQLYPEWVDQGRIKPLYWHRAPVPTDWAHRMGVEPEQVPHIYDLQGISYSQDQRDALEAHDDLSQFTTRMFMLANGTPVHIADYWRERFKLVVEDPAFEAAVTAAGHADSYGYGSPSLAQEAISRAIRMSDEAKEILKNLLGE